MTEVTVIPTNNDTGVSLIAVVLFVLVLLGIFAYFNGWFSMGSTSTDTNINLSVPAPASTSTMVYPKSSEGY